MTAWARSRSAGVLVRVLDEAEAGLGANGGVFVDDHGGEEREIAFGVPGSERADEAERVGSSFEEEKRFDFEVGDGAGRDAQVGHRGCELIWAAERAPKGASVEGRCELLSLRWT